MPSVVESMGQTPSVVEGWGWSQTVSEMSLSPPAVSGSFVGISRVACRGLGFVRRISVVVSRGLGFVRRIRLAQRSGGCGKRPDEASARSSHLEQCRDGPEQRPTARLLVLPESFSLVAVVKGEPGGTLGGLGGFTIVMLLADRDQPRHGLIDDLQEPPPSLAFVRLHREAGQEERPYRIVLGCIERLTAHQADRLAGIRRLPGKAAYQDVAEIDPAVEQPEAAGGRVLKLLDQRRRIFRVGEQPTAQLGGLIVATAFLGIGRVFDDGGQTDCLARSARSSCQEARAACSTRDCSSSSRGWRSAIQASIRPW